MSYLIPTPAVAISFEATNETLFTEESAEKKEPPRKCVRVMHVMNYQSRSNGMIENDWRDEQWF